jgi:hypothetical protein
VAMERCLQRYGRQTLGRDGRPGHRTPAARCAARRPYCTSILRWRSYCTGVHIALAFILVCGQASGPRDIALGGFATDSSRRCRPARAESRYGRVVSIEYRCNRYNYRERAGTAAWYRSNIGVTDITIWRKSRYGRVVSIEYRCNRYTTIYIERAGTAAWYRSNIGVTEITIWREPVQPRGIDRI